MSRPHGPRYNKQPHGEGEQREPRAEWRDPRARRGQRVERVAPSREQVADREEGEAGRAPAITAHGYCFLRPICSISAAISRSSRAMNASKSFVPRTAAAAPVRGAKDFDAFKIGRAHVGTPVT